MNGKNRIVCVDFVRNPILKTAKSASSVIKSQTYPKTVNIISPIPSASTPSRSPNRQAASSLRYSKSNPFVSLIFNQFPILAFKQIYW